MGQNPRILPVSPRNYTHWERPLFRHRHIVQHLQAVAINPFAAANPRIFSTASRLTP
jgi:hypothetical protein